MSHFHALISCRVDYCNSIRYSTCASHLRLLQSVLNGAARLIAGKHKNDHITDTMWLPVWQRIQYKLGSRYAGDQVPLSYGAIIPSRHVHSCVVYNWSSTSPFCCPSRSAKSAQSTGMILITQLHLFRHFDLELVATDCSQPDPYIHWFTGLCSRLKTELYKQAYDGHTAPSW